MNELVERILFSPPMARDQGGVRRTLENIKLWVYVATDAGSPRRF